MRFICLELLPLESTTTQLSLLVSSEPGARLLDFSAKICLQYEVLNVIITSLGLRLLIVGAAYLARLLRDFVPVLLQF